ISGTYVIPASQQPGTYYLMVRADHASQVSESLENNNVKTIQVTVVGLPNLKVVSASADKKFYKPGDTVKLSWLQSNTGAATAKTHTTTVYLSSNSVITTADQLIKNVIVPSMGSNKLQAMSTTFTIPKGTAAGTWYIGLYADRLKGVAESDETDNTKGVEVSIQSLVKLPDLYVSSLSTSAGTYTAGSTLQVNGTLQNIGTTSATTFRVGYYLSTDKNITTKDILLGSKTVSSLANSASTSLLRFVVLPTSVKPGNYYLGVYADDQFKVTEAAENNNTALKAVKVNGVVDLKAISITAGDFYKAGAKDTATVSYTNLGGATAGSHTVGIYLSTDAVVTTNDTLVGQLVVLSVPGVSSKQVKVSFTLPTKLSTGKKYLGAIVDSKNTVKESVESNNRVTKSFTVQSTITKPDLISYNFKVAKTTFKVGDTISWTGFARNIGLSFKTAVANTVWLCPTVVVTKSCTSLKQVTHNGFTQNQVATIAGSWKITSGTKNGTHYVIASVDHTNKVSEMLETNNTTAVKITITGLPDVTAHTLSLNKTSFTPGTTVVAVFSEKNIGGQATGAYTTPFYLSSNTVLSSSDVNLKTLSRASLAAGVTSKLSSVSFVIPTKTTPGTYYLGYRSNYPSKFTETDSSNNTKTIKVTVVAAKPDLVVSSLATTAKSVKPNTSILVTGYVKNQGQAISGAFRVSYWLSSNTQITSLDKLLSTKTISSLVAGGQSSLNAFVKIPADTKAGSYYIGVKVDDLNKVDESSETNNTKATASKITVSALADLAMQNLRLNKATITPGGTLTGFFNETNWSNTQANTHDVKCYLSTDTKYDTKDSLLVTKNLTSISSGAVKLQVFTAKVSATLTVNDYYVICRLDTTNKISEINENNNSAWVPVTYTKTSIAELAHANVSVNAQKLTAGAEVSVSGTLYNLGAKSAGASVTRYYVSATSSVTGLSIKVGETVHKSIAAGKNTSLLKKVKLPTNLTDGIRYFIVQVNATNTVVESYKGNNLIVSRMASEAAATK
ncbi:MAG TPA: hypothetical protein DCQ06_04115, partial [Myxococcales bacterium]|nr:hypothetical protein [Myxococcales bacterium]